MGQPSPSAINGLLEPKIEILHTEVFCFFIFLAVTDDFSDPRFFYLYHSTHLQEEAVHKMPGQNRRIKTNPSLSQFRF